MRSDVSMCLCVCHTCMTAVMYVLVRTSIICFIVLDLDHITRF
jgi:hypothetical protein